MPTIIHRLNDTDEVDWYSFPCECSPYCRSVYWVERLLEVDEQHDQRGPPVWPEAYFSSRMVRSIFS